MHAISVHGVALHARGQIAPASATHASPRPFDTQFLHGLVASHFSCKPNASTGSKYRAPYVQ
eukprot:3939355-Rhodomonas_salina.2